MLGAEFRNAIDELLDGGAVAGPSVNHATSKLRPVATATTTEGEREAGATTSGKPAKVPSVQPRRRPQLRPADTAGVTEAQSQKPARARVRHAASTDPPKPRPERLAKSSAMAALRAKHDSIYSTQPEEYQATVSDEVMLEGPNKKPTAASKVKKPDDHQLPTPLTIGPDTRNNNPQATAGKLPTRLPKTAVAAYNEVNAAENTLSHKRKAVAEADYVEDEQKSTVITESGALKRPTKLAKTPNPIPRKDTYDVPDDDTWHPTTREALQTGANKRPLKSGETSRRVKRRSAVSSTPRPNGRSRNVSKALKASIGKSNTGCRTRHRMQEASISARATPVPENDKDSAPSRALQEINPRNPPQKRQKTNESSPNGKENARQYPAEAPDINEQAEPSAPSPKGIADFIASKFTIGHEPVKVSQVDKNGIELQSTLKDGATSSDPAQGTNKEEAIVISDNASDSSEESSTEPRALRQNVAEVQSRPVARRAETPADDFHSSPPASQRVPKSLRPQIISFGANGPLNQGTNSARKQSAWSGKSALVLTERPKVDHAGTSRRVRLHEERSKTLVSSVRNSNVAQSHEDLFTAFTTQGKGTKFSHVLEQPRSSTQQKARQNQVRDEGFGNIDDYDGPTFFDQGPSPNRQGSQPTISQLAMPPPEGPPREYQGKTATKAATPSRLSHTTRNSTPGRNEPDLVGQKRKHVDVINYDLEMLSKRAKPKEPMPRLTAGAERPEKMARFNLTAPNQAKEVLQEPASPKLVARERGKSVRQASQGSRQVDLQGSPFPRGMAVDDRATARETYSQQVDLSSDSITDAVAKTTAKAVAKLADMTNVIILPPRFTQPEILSSNTKPLPAAPHEESRAIYRRASGAEANQLRTTEPTRDPFTTSFRGTRSSSRRVRPTTSFQQTLRKMHLESRPDPDDDADHTLVEEEDDNRRASRRCASVSTDSSSNTSTVSSKIDGNDDIASWRDALKPHQSNLFDSLVVVSHKLVRHLVDHETAIRDIKSDLRKQGLQIIRIMEQSHIEAYKTHDANVVRRKRRTAKELKSREKALQALMQRTPSQRRERSQVAGLWQEVERNLEGLRNTCT